MKRDGWLRKWAGIGRLKVVLLAVWKLYRHPDTPRAVRWLSVLVLAYALSPIDLIPDFIPVLGLLDDLVLIPLGVALIVKLTPRPLWEARLREADAGVGELPRLWWGAAVIALLWAVGIGLIGWWMIGLWQGAAG